MGLKIPKRLKKGNKLNAQSSLPKIYKLFKWVIHHFKFKYTTKRKTKGKKEIKTKSKTKQSKKGNPQKRKSLKLFLIMNS
jgi:hypothetical protein